MSEFNLGPNGAQIVASDLIIENAELIKSAIEMYEDYYVIFDTPGQIELFSFRPSSPLIVDILSEGQAMIAFVADSIIESTPSGFISQKLLYGSIMSRFFKPSMFLLNKTDLITDEELQKIESWENSTDALNEDFMNEKQALNKQYFLSILSAFKESGLMTKIHKISSKNMTGLEDVYADMSLYFTGGEDYDTLYKDE
ncbi:GTPase [mine drainage metagenome]|uniref:GTPase n=1 Tax=mine drainage metagenome TaxID=410659 RepID=T1AVK2_9ZZZZ